MKQMSFGAAVSSQYRDVLVEVGEISSYESRQGFLVVDPWVYRTLQHLEREGKQPARDHTLMVRALQVAALVYRLGGDRALRTYLASL